MRVFLGRGLSLCFVFDESPKSENVPISKWTVHCDELPPQDGTWAVYLTRPASHNGSLDGRLFSSYSWSTPVPIEFATGSRLFLSRRTIGFGGRCILSRVLLLLRGIFSLL